MAAPIVLIDLTVSKPVGVNLRLNSRQAGPQGFRI